MTPSAALALSWLPSFTALWAAWLFALAGPLILFYFLKLRRPRAVVPSLALWRRVMRDERVNSPFQRFKRNLLLLMQLAALALAVLAAMQPFLRRGADDSMRSVILLDCSASMAALDREGGRSRLDEAKERVARIAGALPPGEEACVVSFASSARKRGDFTDDARALRAALDRVPVEDVEGGLDEALRLAQALSRDRPVGRVLLLTDGNLDPRADFDLPFELDFRRVGPAGPNAGITSFNALRSDDGSWEVFVRVECSGQGDLATAADLTVRRNGAALAKETVMASPSRPARVAFRFPGGTAASLEAALAVRGFDSLASDDRAWLDLPEARATSVHVARPLASFRHALGAARAVKLAGDQDPPPGEARYDLVVTDREPKGVQAGVVLAVGVIPADLAGLVGTRKEPTEAMDWRRDSPLLAHVDLREVVAAEAPVYAEGAGERDLEARGYEVLVHARKGPLLLERRSPEGLACYMTVPADVTTLPYRVAFPVLAANLVRAAAHRSGTAEVRARRTGILEPVPLGACAECVVAGPDGAVGRATADAAGMVSGVAALRVGRYTLSGGGRTATLGASLLSAFETRMEAVEKLELAEQSVEAASQPSPASRSLWEAVALLALAALLVEWWWFHRRPEWLRQGA